MPTVRHKAFMVRGTHTITVRILTRIRIRIPTRTVGDTIRLLYISISDSLCSDLSFVGESSITGGKG